MIIDTVIDALDTALLTDADWGSGVLWGNFDQFGEDYNEDNLPKTACWFSNVSDVQYSTTGYQTSYQFTVRGCFWNGSVITTKADYKKQTALDAQFIALFNPFLKSINCSAFLTDDLQTEYESITNRFYINKTFTITIEELTP